MSKLKTSTMTGKLEGIGAVSTSPLDNAFCQKMRKSDSICKDCYSCAMLEGLRKNCRPRWKENGEILKKKLQNIPSIKERLFRFSAHGELHNKEHYRNYVRIAKQNPSVKFALFTKRANLICEDAPKNVTMVYSNPNVDKVRTVPPKGFHKVFNVVTGDNVRVNCGKKKCADCGTCFSRKGTKVIIEKLK